ncbi:sarcosine oxidase subunit gamma [Stappia indica]|uniref:Sarcosine oxidase subunit gamma n=1 Tax=Stappia indica TaxID=538381 RepID=A0A857C2T3_9HYPH|nr:sarcosine oxidase subunit gamma family protein [Stappia indica]QGZ33161.1 sarcosine oxidase subunit gamma [Stappia indica]
MPDALFHTPAETLALPRLAGTGTTLHRAAPLVRFVFRGDAAAAEKAGAAFGVPLPQSPLAAETSGERAALWQGPDEWLLLARPAGDGPQAVDALARSLAGEIAAALGDTPHSLVDVSERNVALLIEGPGASDLLNTHVFLDLDPAAFPVGMVTRTLFTKAEIVLWRTGGDAFALECWSSFAPYVEAHLAEA